MLDAPLPNAKIMREVGSAHFGSAQCVHVVCYATRDSWQKHQETFESIESSFQFTSFSSDRTGKESRHDNSETRSYLNVPLLALEVIIGFLFVRFLLRRVRSRKSAGATTTQQLAQDRPAPFGGRVTDVMSKSFICVVTTAKEGMTQGLSTIVHAMGEDGETRPCAKFIYRGSINKTERQGFHTLISNTLQMQGDEFVPMTEAIEIVEEVLDARNALELCVYLPGSETIDRDINGMVSNCIGMIKLGLSSRVFAMCPKDVARDYSIRLTAAAVNTVFSDGPSDDRYIQFVENEENQAKIQSLIREAIVPHGKLKQIIGDVIRFRQLLQPGSWETTFPSYEESTERLKQLGLIVPERGKTDLQSFANAAGEFLVECKPFLDSFKAARQ